MLVLFPYLNEFYRDQIIGKVYREAKNILHIQLSLSVIALRISFEANIPIIS